MLLLRCTTYGQAAQLKEGHQMISNVLKLLVKAANTLDQDSCLLKYFAGCLMTDLEHRVAKNQDTGRATVPLVLACAVQTSAMTQQPACFVNRQNELRALAIMQLHGIQELHIWKLGTGFAHCYSSCCRSCISSNHTGYL